MGSASTAVPMELREVPTRHSGRSFDMLVNGEFIGGIDEERAIKAGLLLPDPPPPQPDGCVVVVGGNGRVWVERDDRLGGRYWTDGNAEHDSWANLVLSVGPVVPLGPSGDPIGA